MVVQRGRGSDCRMQFPGLATMADLFGSDAPVVESGHRPLADRFAARKLGEVIGQFAGSVGPGRAVDRIA